VRRNSSRNFETHHNLVTLLFLISAILVLVACDRSTLKDNDSTDKNPQERYSPFIAPEDSRLTEKQVQRYIAVKNTEKELLDNLQDDLQNKWQSNPTSSGATHYKDIEQRAVQLNHLSSEEYLWIKNTVINSRIQQQFQEYFALNRQIISLLEGTLQRHEATRKNLKDPEEIAVLDSHVREINEHILTLKNQIEKFTNLSDSQQHNIALTESFNEELEAIEKYQLSVQTKDK